MRPIVTDRVAWSVGVSVCPSICQSVTLVSPAKRLNRSRCRLSRELGWSQGTMLDGVRSTIGRGNFEGRGKGRPIAKYRDALRSSVQKQLNRSRCRLGCGFGCAQGIMC